MRLLIASMLALVLVGCGGGGGGGDDPSAPDADADGFADASDCAPANAQAWRMLDYASVDNDSDSARINSAGQVCAGAGLPANRSAAAVPAANVDCNDADASVYVSRPYEAVDADGDGFGVASAGSICSGAAGLPLRYFATVPATASLDCDDGNVNAWAASPYVSRDLDNDSYRVNVAGSFCGTGTMPTNYFYTTATLLQLDCDDAVPTVWRWMGVYGDQDGDGVGAGPMLRQCVGATLSPGFVTGGYDPNDDPNDVMAAGITEVPINGSLLSIPGDANYAVFF